MLHQARASARINGPVVITNLNRRVQDNLIEMAPSHGIAPIECIVGYDALVANVQLDNSVEGRRIILNTGCAWCE